MSRIKQKKKVLTSIFILLVLIIGIGYAYLNSNLSINGITEISSNTWDIHFENVQISEGSIAIEAGGSAAIINPSDNTEVTYSVKLNKPGDYYEFTVDVKNYGTIDGMVESISSTLSVNNAEAFTILSDKSNLPAYLDYSVTYSDGLTIEPNHELKVGNKETYKVRVEYKKDITSEQLPTNNSVHLLFSLRPVIIQADENAINGHLLTSPEKYVYDVKNIEMAMVYKNTDLALNITPRDTPEEAIDDWLDFAESKQPFYMKQLVELHNVYCIVFGEPSIYDDCYEDLETCNEENINGGTCETRIAHYVKEYYVEFIVNSQMATNGEMNVGKYTFGADQTDEEMQQLLDTAFNNHCEYSSNTYTCESSTMKVILHDGSYPFIESADEFHACGFGDPYLYCY